MARRDNNPDNPLSPPDGRTGRPEFSSQPFSIDAVNEFEPVIEDIYRFAETQGLAVDTLIHEEGVAQFEINFKHDDALIMADQVVMFKRCVREAAIKNGIVATFMAKPVEGRPGSSCMSIKASFRAPPANTCLPESKTVFPRLSLHTSAACNTTCRKYRRC